ncbi:Gldg family protein [Calycomorphotria hydatis]|uniref:ABC-type uncharacterized transport system n=1 Tax=Calycomorphotria hydatis TaxID=2528027 RepID=A0A517TDY0_9PLAN|nr:Gldg family protein [Calycomorphotria hydatis]QDT66579.1 ABC-type uncharacterized transport system [Calycomorphotria hydatis]
MQSLLALLIVVLSLAPFALLIWRAAVSPVVRAVFWRNVSSYFSGILGYLFIVVFVVAASLLAFNQRFFTNNLADLDQLSQSFPLLLLFLIPAITMAVWSEERKQGTDELLFTLPASDLDILIGKYLAVLAVYTAVLAFSVTDLLFLEWIGDPDWGTMFATYVGYWFAGASLLGAGMLMSSITGSVTVAFVLGAVVCSIPVFVSRAPRSFFGLFDLPREALNDMGIASHLRDFAVGVLPTESVFYFVSIGAFMLYLNYVVIRKRHWAADEQGQMGLQYTIRAVSLAVTLIALNVLAGLGTARADLTAEHLFSLDKTTRQTIRDLKQPVTIQAFVSPDVPSDYVPVRRQLLGLLRQYEQMGGPKIDLRVVDVEPFSEESEEAELLGITPQRVLSENDGRQTEEEIYLGVVFSSTYDEVMIPNFGPGSLLEYELTRSLGTVANEKRLTVGVLQTDASIIGGQQEWQIVQELRLQYDVDEVSPDSEISTEKYDVLLVVMPSSLTQPQMDNLVAYVKTGKPTLIFADPYPMTLNPRGMITNAPRMSKPAPGGPFNQQPPPEPKAENGRLTSLTRELKINWTPDSIVWDRYNPHPEFGALVPLEYLFIKNREENPEALATGSEVTSGLQEMLLAYAGEVQDTQNADHEYTPLVLTGTNSGVTAWDDLFENSFDPFSFRPAYREKPNAFRERDSSVHAVAAHVRPKEGEEGPNVIFVTDIDVISDWFFQQRLQNTSLRFDNVTFVLNAVDVLAGQEEYLDLRGRRAKQRTLTKVEARTAKFYKELQQNQEEAEAELDQELQERRAAFADKRKEIEADTSLSRRQREEQLRILASDEEQKLLVAEQNLRQEAREKNLKAQATTMREIRETENLFWLIAILLPPIPAVLLGAGVAYQKVTSERRVLDPERIKK